MRFCGSPHDDHGAILREYPADVLQGLRRVSAEVVAEVAQQDALSKKVYDAYKAFLDASRPYTRISELAYLQARQ